MVKGPSTAEVHWDSRVLSVEKGSGDASYFGEGDSC